MIAELIVFILGLAVVGTGTNILLVSLLVVAIMRWIKERKEE